MNEEQGLDLSSLKDSTDEALSEVLQRIVDAIETLNLEVAKIREELGTTAEATAVMSESMLSAYDSAVDEAQMSEFGDKWRSELSDEHIAKLRHLYGADYDAMRALYEDVKQRRDEEGFVEENYVNEVLADVKSKLDAIQLAVSEEPVVEEVIVEAPAGEEEEIDWDAVPTRKSAVYAR